VLFGTDKFRPYLEHAEFLLETYNQALSWLLSHPRQLGKIGRWVVKISLLKFKVQHVRDTQNVVVDALSLMFDVPQNEIPSVSCNAFLSHFPLFFRDLAALQREDPELCQLIEKLEKKEEVSKFSLFIVDLNLIVGETLSCRRPRFQCFSTITTPRHWLDT
jgi:hypothetical protein